MGRRTVVNRWGLVTAWAVEHDRFGERVAEGAKARYHVANGRTVTIYENEAKARIGFDHWARTTGEELVLWSPGGEEERLPACDSAKVAQGYGFAELRGLEDPIW